MPRSSADSQEDNPVNGALNGEIQVALQNAGISQGNIFCQIEPPRLDFLQERRIDRSRSLLNPLVGEEPIERAAANGLGREQLEKLVPTRDVFGNVRDK